MSEGYQGGGGGCLRFYHVPQQSRREKLRYPNTDEPPFLHHHHHPPPPSLEHYNNPVTTSFMSPSSSSYNLVNPSYSASPYDHATPTLLRDHILDHPLFDHHHQQGQGVSLSLSSSSGRHHHHHHQFDAPVLGGPWPLSASTAPVPDGPFTGYAAILKRSGFLRPAQLLLEEVCDVGGGALVCGGDELEALDFSAAEGVSECGGFADGSISGEGGEHGKVKTRLISMLDEVYRSYKHYYQQIQAVIMAFESASGLITAAPYTSLALNSMSKHFRCMKNAISDQLQFTNKAIGGEPHGREEIPGIKLINGGLCYQRASHTSGAINQQHVWRPQRGLPERAVAVLRAWLFEHFLHPYPSDMDKQMLAKQTGLSRNQVSNWFINARVRLWKPMVEEIHSLEMRQTHRVPEADNSSQNHNKQSQLPTASADPSTTINKQTPLNIRSQKNPDPPLKRLRNELTQIPDRIEEPLNFAFNDLSSHHHHHHQRVGVGMGVSGAGNGDVSLTLGLHQNNGICLSEPLPLNVVRRFGLEESNVAYVMGAGFEGHDQHFGKEIDRQLLRDFVG